MTVSVSMNVTLLRELEEVVDEDEEAGDEDGMKKGNSTKTAKQPVLSAQIEPSEQRLGKSRRNISSQKASPEEEGKTPMKMKVKERRLTPLVKMIVFI